MKSALKTDGSHSKEGFDIKKTSNTKITPGIPPILHGINHLSARGCVGVRSKYVDTFNRGGGKSANRLQSPSVPATKSVAASNAKFFIPAPVQSSKEQTMEAIEENNQEDDSACKYWQFRKPYMLSILRQQLNRSSTAFKTNSSKTAPA